VISALANHLWQSTVCVGAAAILASMLRRQAARFRYRIWLVASLKFLVPFSLLIGLGRLLPVVPLERSPRPLVSASAAVRVLGAPFVVEVSSRVPGTTAAATALEAISGTLLAKATIAIWATGSLLLIIFRWACWRRLAAAARASQPLRAGREAEALDRARERLRHPAPIDLRASASRHEPGVIGTIRPMVLWPSALTSRLTDAELDAIFVHEVSHVRRRDNLAATLHALLETVLWFHPVVWWLGARLLEERERACDEAVLKVGSERQTYAASILKVCDFCLQTPAAWVAGVTGARLKTRVEEIMSVDRTQALCRGQRAVLAITAVLVATIPVALGAIWPNPSREAVAAFANPIAAPAVAGPSTVVAPSTARPVPAPVQVSTGRLTGVVTDQSGGVIPGATVAIAGARRTAITDANGRYSMANLEPGQYEMVVQMTGFRPSRAIVRIDPAIEATRDVRLTIGTVTESLNIRCIGGWVKSRRPNRRWRGRRKSCVPSRPPRPWRRSRRRWPPRHRARCAWAETSASRRRFAT
jgi:beta-lactamase regulating signal transducer with metallopeptidase domain